MTSLTTRCTSRIFPALAALIAPELSDRVRISATDAGQVSPRLSADCTLRREFIATKGQEGFNHRATEGIFLRSFGETLSSMLAKLESLPQSTKDHDVRLVSNIEHTVAGSGRIRLKSCIHVQ